MQRIRLLKSECVETLKNSIEENLERYRSGGFSDLLVDFELPIEIDYELLKSLKSPDDDDLKDAENCATLFECLKDISPYLARDERLWTYLTHSLLIEYTRKRWPIPDDNEKAIAHIKSHFYATDKRSLEARNAVSRLYWLAYMAARVEDIPLKHTLDIIMEKTDVRANVIERPTVLQASALMVSVVHQLKKSQDQDVKQRLFERKNFRELQRRLNEYCGYTLVECLPADAVEKLVDQIVIDILATAEQSA